jgi:hypothetical protein
MTEIPRPDKILLAIHQLSGGTTKAVEYEDIVVAAWKLFPEDFGLRKYVHEYPDASDIHKPLYGPLKARGLVLSGNKKFKLTDKGVEYAAKLEQVRQGIVPMEEIVNGEIKPERLSRNQEAELRRIIDTDAFKYFATGQKEKILDTDFYAYLGATVRTERHEFLGRVTAVADAVANATKISQNPKHQLAAQLHAYVCERFSEIIDRKKGKA